jgi:signal transduction histidine kinase
MTSEQTGPARSHEQRIIDTLYRVAGFTKELTDLNRLLTMIMNESERVMESEASSCMLYDETTDELYFEVALGEKAEDIKTMRLKRGTGIAWKCLEENRTLTVNDVQHEKSHYAQADEKARFVTRNLVATPMIDEGQIIGVLEVLNKRGDVPYDEQDAKILSIVAEWAGVAIAKARRIERSIQQQRLAAIGLAVSGIAHHLKNIILAIKGPLGLVRLGIKMQNQQLLNDSLPIMERGSSRMEQSVKEMLDYSKDREPELELGNIKDLLGEIVEGCRTRAQQARVELRYSPSPDIADSYLDKYRLHDAILNIVGNAIEAHERSPEGAWVEARVRLSQNGARHVIDIQDNAGGIPEEVVKKIFQPFFSTKGSKGTGLGLAVAVKVAQENKGTLSMETKVGEGTTFTFALPVVTEAPAAPETDEGEG